MSRNIPLVTDEFYHVYNRGVAKQPTFRSYYDYKQAILGISYYQFEKVPMRLSRLKLLSVDKRLDILSSLNGEKLAEVISYVLMPNHFHFLLKQKSNDGISTFIRKFINSYTKYFNTKNKRVGPLFQGVFKYTHIEDDEQLIHVSRYIHLNPLVSYIVKEKDFLDYPWSSFKEYRMSNPVLINSNPVLDHFASIQDYESFVLDQVDYAKKLEYIKHLTLES